MNSIKRVVLALGLVSLGSIGQITLACSTGGCCTTSSNCCKTDCGDCCCYGGYYTSKSYFSDKIVPFASATYLRDALFRIDAADAREDGFGGAIQVVPFGGRTTDHGSKELARWFGYNHKGVCGCPIVFSDKLLDQGQGLFEEGALASVYFNCFTANQTFQSNVTFSPRQKFFGVGLDWKQVIFFNDDCTRRWWFELSAPIVHIENDMRMCETIINDGGGAYLVDKGINDQAYVATMSEAFAQPGMKYGRILTCNTCTNNCTTTSSSCSSCCSSDSCDAMKKTRIADIELKLGYNQSLTECATLDTYLGLVFPTGNKAKGQYVFEAVVGGQHWGIMLGGELGFDLYHHDCGDLKWFAAADLRYLFHNEQVRSFDLVGKPWSRYMTVFATKEKAQAAAADENNAKYADFGINYLTRCVDVHPRCQFNFDTSFAWDGEHFLAEVGYGLYARQAERIDPNWVEGPVLKEMYVAPTQNVLNVASSIVNLATNANVGLALYDDVKIKTCDIDWNTAAHPAVLNNSVYGTLGYKWGDVCYPTMLSVGGAWDFAFSNTAMHKWTIFGKLGVSF